MFRTPVAAYKPIWGEIPMKWEKFNKNFNKNFDKLRNTLNLHRVTQTNFKVWSFPKISSLHNISTFYSNNRFGNGLEFWWIDSFNTSLYRSKLLNNFFATNFLRWVIVAWDEHRMNFLFIGFMWFDWTVSRRMFTCSSLRWQSLFSSFAASLVVGKV